MRAARPLPAAAAAAISLVACAARAPTPPPPPPDEPFVLVAPHWDQPCLDAREPVHLRLEEVIDTTGLSAWLADRLASATLAAPLSISAPGAAPSPAFTRGTERRVDIGVIYAASGYIRSAHLQGQTVDSATAAAVAARVGAAILPQARLLEPVFLRVRVRARPAPRLRLLPPLRCMPHIEHDGLAPTRIGDARLEVGRAPRAGAGEESVALRLRLTADGTLAAVEFRAGNARLLARARRDLSGVVFNPTLLNGMAVPGVLNLVLRYPLPERDVETTSRTSPPASR